MIDAELRDARIETNGVSLHVVQAGPEDGPLVLLLHGFPEFWYGWRHQIDPLVRAGYRVWIPDQRGYNTSDKPRAVKSYHLDQLAGDIFGLIRAAGAERARVVGHDWGAAVAWWMALVDPGRIEKLAILNVPHPVVMEHTVRSSLQQLKKSWYIFFFQLPWVPERVFSARDCERGTRMLRATSTEGAFTDEDLARYVEAWKQPGAPRAMLAWYRAAVRYRPRPPTDRVSPPTLILWGENDVALSREMAPASAQLCDHGRLELFESATHWVQHDEPARVNELLLDHLA